MPAANGTDGATAHRADACAVAPANSACETSKGRALVTLWISNGAKKRAHVIVTRLPMEAYAQRVGASFHVVDSFDHPSLAKWNMTLRTGSSSHFMKLPMLQWFLSQYSEVLFVDDDILFSPFA